MMPSITVLKAVDKLLRYPLNKEPSRIYRRTIVTDSCPACAIIALSLTPAAAADAAKPDRKLCPEYLLASSPAAAAARFTTMATALSDSRPSYNWPCTPVRQDG